MFLRPQFVMYNALEITEGILWTLESFGLTILSEL